MFEFELELTDASGELKSRDAEIEPSLALFGVISLLLLSWY